MSTSLRKVVLVENLVESIRATVGKEILLESGLVGRYPFGFAVGFFGLGVEFKEQPQPHNRRGCLLSTYRLLRIHNLLRLL